MMRPALVLLPGNMCDDRLWSRCAFPDGWPLGFAALTEDDGIEEMAARTLRSVGGSVIPLGFSMGGIVALEMARQAPDRIPAMVLADTNAGADLPERATMRLEQQRRVREGALAEIVANELKPSYLAAGNRGDSDLKELLLDMAMGLGTDVFARQSEALRTRRDNWPVLDAFDGAALFLCGAEDALCPPSLHEQMALRCADAALSVIDGAGHMLPLEQPQRFSRAVSTFLQSLEEDDHDA